MKNNRKSVMRAQMRELMFVGYVILFLVEYIYRLLKWTPRESNGFADAYHEVSLVKEQERKQKFSSWARDRKKYFWLKYWE